MRTIVFILISLISISCNKDCNEPKDSKCSEVPPTGVVCQAYFESWIYNANENKCELVGYSGCNAIGFETEEACNQCECKKN